METRKLHYAIGLKELRAKLQEDEYAYIYNVNNKEYVMRAKDVVIVSVESDNEIVVDTFFDYIAALDDDIDVYHME
jgi:hypothetical protein